MFVWGRTFFTSRLAGSFFSEGVHTVVRYSSVLFVIGSHAEIEYEAPDSGIDEWSEQQLEDKFDIDHFGQLIHRSDTSTNLDTFPSHWH